MRQLRVRQRQGEHQGQGAVEEKGEPLARGAVVPHAPQFTLHCRTREGEQVALLYSPHSGELTDADGQPLLSDVEPWDFADAPALSPANPGRKSPDVATLKIQLGMRCNYSCSYCNQAGSAADASVTRTADADSFLRSLGKWLHGAPSRVEFWGGEPLLYFAKLRRLVPSLRERFPDAEFSIITNGSLLDEEILAFIERWDLFVSVSHDGPGQHLRGPDPFDDPHRARWLRELWRRRGSRQRVAFNVVVTPANADIRATRAWLAAKVGDSGVALDLEGIVAVYDDHTLHGSGMWAPGDYARLQESIVDAFATGEAFQYRSLQEKARDFVQSLQRRRPASALGQKCGMDRPDELAVDLQGNVMTCQNTGARGKHLLGNVGRLDEVALTTATHWSHRDCCNHCPVVQLCRGSCMYLEGDHFAQSCENEYRFNTAILQGLVTRITGLQVEKISGDIRRPRQRRVIAIAPLAVP
jgi:uncharacterized protein